MVGLRRHRRQVRDGEDLLTLAQLTKTLADLLGDLAADAGVHLVEDRDDVLVRRFEREGQQDSAELSPTREGLQRSLGLSGIRREQYPCLRPVVPSHDEAQCRVGERHARQLSGDRRA